MTVERRIVFSPEDLIVRLICRKCESEIFVKPDHRRHECGQCGEYLNSSSVSESIEVQFFRFLRYALQSKNEDVRLVLEIKDPR